MPQRRFTLLLSLLALGCLIGLFTPPAFAQSQLSEHTFRLDEDGVRAPATIDDLAWLAGYWRGEGLGGQVEELWSSPLAGRMIGAFRLIKDDETVFSEALQLEQDGESLVMRVKHFTPEFVGWEEKGDSVDFRLIRTEGKTAYFNGLTLQASDADTLHIYLVLKGRDGQTREETFRLQRFNPPK